MQTSISQNAKERAHYHSRMLFQMDEQSNRAAERRMGREEGRKEGREEGRSEQALVGARNLIARNYPLNDIAVCLGLPMSIVEKLRDEVDGDDKFQ